MNFSIPTKVAVGCFFPFPRPLDGFVLWPSSGHHGCFSFHLSQPKREPDGSGQGFSLINLHGLWHAPTGQQPVGLRLSALLALALDWFVPVASLDVPLFGFRLRRVLSLGEKPKDLPPLGRFRRFFLCRVPAYGALLGLSHFFGDILDVLGLLGRGPMAGIGPCTVVDGFDGVDQPSNFGGLPLF